MFTSFTSKNLSMNSKELNVSELKKISARCKINKVCCGEEDDLPKNPFFFNIQFKLNNTLVCLIALVGLRLSPARTRMVAIFRRNIWFSIEI